MDRGAGLLRPIELRAEREEGWSRTAVGKKQGLRPMLPQFRLGVEVIQQLEGMREEAIQAGNGVLLGVRSSPLHYLSVRVEALRRQSRPGKGLAGDYAITVGRLEGVEAVALEQILRELDRQRDNEPVEPLHLCKTLCCVYKEKGNSGLLRIRMKVIYPAVSLQFTPIAPLKVVSTPLSVQLLKTTKQSGSFLWGLIALDKRKRVVLLLPSDPHTTHYAMAGIWATNLPPLPSSPTKSPFLHPLIWSLSIHYLHQSSLFPRVSPDPAHHVFLFLYIASTSAKFCEVSSGGETTGWGWMEVERRLDTSAAVVVGFGKEEEKARELGREMSTTEVGRREHIEAQPSRPSLQKDSKYPYQPLTCRPAQSQVVSPALSPRSSLDLSPSFPATKPHKPSLSSAYVRKSAEEATLIGFKMRDLHMETDFQVPRIRYESESESSDDESFQRIKQKYQQLLH